MKIGVETRRRITTGAKEAGEAKCMRIWVGECLADTEAQLNLHKAINGPDDRSLFPETDDLHEPLGEPPESLGYLWQYNAELLPEGALVARTVRPNLRHLPFGLLIRATAGSYCVRYGLPHVLLQQSTHDLRRVYIGHLCRDWPGQAWLRA